MRKPFHRSLSLLLALVLVASTVFGVLPAMSSVANAADADGTIHNDSLRVTVGDLGQISTLNIVNNPLNNDGGEINFVLPNNTAPQNGPQHQWMGEMIFSVRSSEDGNFPADNTGFEEVDTNKTLAAGGSTTYSNATENLAANPYIEKTVTGDSKVEIDFKGQDLNSTAARVMKGFDVNSVFDTDTEDGSVLWSITIKNKSDKYLEFGDVGLPMPWNNKYDYGTVYSQRVTAHTFAGADSGYAYAIRCSGEGNYILFTPVPETGARIEYVDNWIGSNNGVSDNRTGDLYTNWTGDGGGWQPGLSVYYIHSKDIRKTGRSYFKDNTSLILNPGESKTYSFKFSAVRAGDNTPQQSAEDSNNASASIEQRENNLRSILYQNGMIDAIAVPGFQTALNLPTKLDLHYDDERIQVESVDIQCVHENDPYGQENIPYQVEGRVNNSRAERGVHEGNSGYTESAELVETKTVDGEKHHIYNLKFACIGNNSVRVNYKLKVGEEWVDKFTQFEFNVLTELDQATDAHATFMVDKTQDTDPDSATYGIFSDWYLSSGKDSAQQTHWGDDWSHDNINFIAMKNYLDPDPKQVKAIETYLIDFMWNNYMKNTQEDFIVANYLRDSGAYSSSSNPYTRTFSEVMEATGFFNMYRIVKAYPDLIDYRQPATWYLEKAYGIYSSRVWPGETGFYGEQQIPDMIEALYAEGMTDEAEDLQESFALYKGSTCVNVEYPYGSEFSYDNTGEEGAYTSAKALMTYYPDDPDAALSLAAMSKANHKTRAMRGFQPTWYQYADPVFIGGESWWNFQYTASLAGYIMDDWMRYQEPEDGDSAAWAARVNYAAKLSNFNAINMGQISADSVGSVSWRYNMYKGGYGAMNVNDGGTRVMNNGWQDFSGESDEGLYGSLLSISADVIDDPIFGLYGYGAEATEADGVYTVKPIDGFGRRVNLLNEKIYVETTQDSIEQAKIAKDGSSITLQLKGYTDKSHASTLEISGAGVTDGYYTVKSGDTKLGQIYVEDNAGSTTVTLPEGATTEITLTADETAENAAPVVKVSATPSEPQALVPFEITAAATDDGAASAHLTYQWSVETQPEGAEITIAEPAKPVTQVVTDTQGDYVLKVEVSDGEKTTTESLSLTVGEAPERKAPEITVATAKQILLNPSEADLHAEATLDEYYNGTAVYEWSVVSKPEGSTTVLSNADKQDAKLLVSMPGEYKLSVKVTDADKSSSREVTIEMDENADGLQRVDAVATKVGEAPELPETASVIHADGSVSDETVVWDDVAAEDYAKAGIFEVTGTAGTDIGVAVSVHVVATDRINVAPYATPTAVIDTPWDLGGVAGLNDGNDPASSRDTSHGVWHNWLGDNGDTAWVRYDWDDPVLIDGNDAYYYTDGNFVPKDVLLEYLDENGDWQEVPNPVGYGTELNKYNTTNFSPIKTTALRMTMNPKTLGVGVIEWKVYGYSYSAIIDRNALRSAIAAARALNMNHFVEGTKEILDAAIAEAEAVLNSEESTQEEIDAAAAALNKTVAGLETSDGNLAYTAAVSTSFVSGWESLDAVNDGVVPANSYNPSESRYGTWGNTSGSESVTYTWGAPVKLNATDIYFWYDGTEYTNGGINVPRSYVFEYLNDEGDWTAIADPEGYGLEMDKFNATSLGDVVTTALRVTMTKQAFDGNGVGIMEWKVYGEVYEEPSTPVDTTALQAAIDKAEALKAEEYTEESYKAVTDALAKAKDALESDDQAVVDAAEKALTDAIAALEKKPDTPPQPSGEVTIDFTEAAAGTDYTIANPGSEASYTTDGKLKLTAGAAAAFEPCIGWDKGQQTTADPGLTEAQKTNPVDVVEVPAPAGDWTATLDFNFATTNTQDSAGYYAFFGFYAMEEEGYNNGLGIRGGDGSFQDWLRQDGADPVADTKDRESTNADKPEIGGFKIGGAFVPAEYWFRIVKEGTTYTCSWSDDGETFHDRVVYEDIDMDISKFVIDAYSGMGTGFEFTLNSLTIESAGGSVTPAKPDTKALQAAIDKAEALKAEDYTANSYKAVTDALAAAKAALNAETQDEVDAAEKALTDAISALKKAPDPAAVAAAQAAAEAAQRAKTAAEAAEKAADEAAQTAGADKSAVEAARKAADEAKAKADTAQAAAEAAQKAADDSDTAAAQKAADAAAAAAEVADALKEVADAQAKVIEAQAKAEAAQKAADEAAQQAAKDKEDAAAAAAAAAKDKEDAEKAKADAEAAQKAADEAAQQAAKEQEDAEKAKADAEAAQKAAAEAQAKAEAAQKAAEEALKALEDASKACPSAKFTDVPAEGNWAHAGIDYCVANGLMDGVSADKFNPSGTLTRAQLVTILYRLEGEPEVTTKGTFTDVPDGKWYSDAIEWAAENEIVNGVGEGKFNPTGAVTREQIAAILYRYNESPAVTGDLSKYPDNASVSSYATNAMIWATSEGILTGVKSGEEVNLVPKASATRAQIATIMARLSETE